MDPNFRASCFASCGRCANVSYLLRGRALVSGANASAFDASAFGRGLVRSSVVTIGTTRNGSLALDESRVVVDPPKDMGVSNDASFSALQPPRLAVPGGVVPLPPPPPEPVVSVSFSMYYGTKADRDKFAALLQKALDGALAVAANEAPAMRDAHLLGAPPPPVLDSVAWAPPQQQNTTKGAPPMSLWQRWGRSAKRNG